jgi:type II secretory ATPase GspE/PulE/Tfp pilus assembly ATPase PilB-like protein
MSSLRPKYDHFTPLIEQGVLTETDFQQAVAEAQEHQLPLEQVLMRRLRVPKEALGAALAAYYKCPFVPFDPRYPVPPRTLLRGLKAGYLRTDHFVPLAVQGNKVTVLIDDPNHLIKRDEVRALLRAYQIDYCVGLKEDIEAFVDHFFAAQVEPVADAPSARSTHEEVREEDVQEIIEYDEVRIAELLGEIVRDARQRGATSVHLLSETDGQPLQVRLRIDGACLAARQVPALAGQTLRSHIRALSGLDPAQAARPQEGRIRLGGAAGGEVRVATLPLLNGTEDVVLHLSGGPPVLPLREMRFSERNLLHVESALAMPYGLLLCAGPAGSGRTATLHAMLAVLDQPDRRICAIQDPIEITLPGLRQVAAAPGLSAVGLLQATLATDPDAVLLGSLGDGPACAAALQAALAGRLVLGPLRARTAVDALTWLLDQGLDPYGVADAVVLILAQRLVRLLCNDCKEPYLPGQDELLDLAEEYGVADVLQLGVSASDPQALFRPRGCDQCNHTGYSGRMALHEVLEITDDLRRLIQRRHPPAELREQALRDGMTTLKQDGIEKVLQGLTDLREVRAACSR